MRNSTIDLYFKLKITVPELKYVGYVILLRRSTMKYLSWPKIHFAFRLISLETQ